MKPLTIFTHVPKTAGTSFMHSVLIPTFGEDRIVDVQIRQFRNRVHEEHEVVVGHNAYGGHLLTRRPVRYVTFLREPIDRAISHYYFIRGCDPRLCQHPLYGEAMRLSLSDFYRQQRFQNGMARMIAGFWWDNWMANLPGIEKMLRRVAESNLRTRYVAFGIQERFHESIKHIVHDFGWKCLPTRERHKETHDRIGMSDLDSNTLEVLIDAHQADIDLYRYAEQLFDTRVRETCLDE